LRAARKKVKRKKGRRTLGDPFHSEKKKRRFGEGKGGEASDSFSLRGKTSKRGGKKKKKRRSRFCTLLFPVP